MKLNPHGASCSTILQLFSFRVFFFFVSVRSLGKTSAWEGYLPCPILLDRTVLLHLLWLSKETLWITAQLLPQLNGLFTSADPRMLPKTMSPLCGYSTGLHAPNSGSKSSLKKSFFFFFLQDTWACACLCLWHKLLYTKLTMPASLMCKWNPPAITAPFSCYKLHKTPGSVRWQWGGPNWPRCWPRCCPRLGLGQGHFADARWRCFHSSSQHWR